MTAPRKAPAKRAIPHKPAGVREPQDHLKPAAQREAEGDEMIPVQWRDLSFEVPADPDDWPIRVHQALGRNMHIDAIELLLGPVQWAKLTGKYPKRRDFIEFADVLGEVLGFGTAGN